MRPGQAHLHEWGALRGTRQRQTGPLQWGQGNGSWEQDDRPKGDAKVAAKGGGDTARAARNAELLEKVKAPNGDDKATAGCGGWLRLKEIDACAAGADPSSKINMVLS